MALIVSQCQLAFGENLVRRRMAVFKPDSYMPFGALLRWV
jgi:hypothetical protein